METLICSNCYKEFQGRSTSDRSFCSEKCHRLWLVELRRMADKGDADALKEFKMTKREKAASRRASLKKKADRMIDVEYLRISRRDFNQQTSKIINVWERIASYLLVITILMVVGLTLGLVSLLSILTRTFP